MSGNVYVVPLEEDSDQKTGQHSSFLTYLLEGQYDSCLFTTGTSGFSNSLEFYHTAHSCEMFLSLSCRGSVQVVECRVQ